MNVVDARADDVSLRLHERLRRVPSPSTVPGSLPVLFFGDIFTASVASIGLNPSKQEYLDPSGNELTGHARRFETLDSLGCLHRSELTNRQCQRAITTMRGYFQRGRPVYSWFRPLARVMEGMGYSYQAGEVVHLDLVQEATDPTWSELNRRRRDEAKALLEADLPFLVWQLMTFRIQLLVCNGRTVFDTVMTRLNADECRRGSLARVVWYASSASLDGRRVNLVGWNLPLVRPTGLGANGERRLGKILAEAVAGRSPMSGAASNPSVKVSKTKQGVGSGTSEGMTKEILLRRVERRRRAVRNFLEWAHQKELSGESLRWDARRDIVEAREATGWFAEPWWAVVVFTCFGSLRGARAVAGSFERPVTVNRARSLLRRVSFPRGSIGHHRIRPGVTGAKKALVAACGHARDFKKILLHGDGFHDTYEAVRSLRAEQWGRTTCFDLVLRRCGLGIGGRQDAPDRAYLADSTGPASGFEKVWGVRVSHENAERCEALLRAWTANWAAVAHLVETTWSVRPYTPGDFENALCIFQEEVRKTSC